MPAAWWQKNNTLRVYVKALAKKQIQHMSLVSCTEQQQTYPPVAGPWHCPGKPTWQVVNTMGSNNIVVGEDHLLEPSSQQNN